MPALSGPLECQMALEEFAACCQGTPCGSSPKKPCSGPQCNTTPQPPCIGPLCPPCTALCTSGGPQTVIFESCAPCQDGSIPALPDCECPQPTGCGCGLPFCACQYEQCLGGQFPGVKGITGCLSQLGACEKSPPPCAQETTAPVYSTIEVAPLQCSPPAHEPPCGDCELPGSGGCCSGILDPRCAVIGSAAPPASPSVSMPAAFMLPSPAAESAWLAAVVTL